MWKSKHDYFWLAFIIFLYVAPGRLFSYASGLNSVVGLPVYSVVTGVTIGFEDLVIITYILKLINKKSKVFRNKYLLALLIFIFSYFVYSVALGMDSRELILSIRNIGTYMLCLPIIWLIDKRDIKIFFTLVTSIIFLSLIFQLFFYLNHKSVAHMITGIDIDRETIKDDISIATIRYMDSLSLLFPVFVTSFFFLSSYQKYFSKIYLVLINIIAFVIVFMSGTRGFVLSFMFVYFLVFLSNAKTFRKQIFLLFPIAFVGFILSYYFGNLVFQFKNAFTRLSTLQFLFQGDMTLGNTAARIDYIQSMVNKTFENPIFGWGISSEASVYKNSDGGMALLFLQVGVVGLVILSVMFIHYLLKINFISKSNPRYKRYNIFIFGLLGLVLIHSTSSACFNFFSFKYFSLITALYFGFINLIIKNRVY